LKGADFFSPRFSFFSRRFLWRRAGGKAAKKKKTARFTGKNEGFFRLRRKGKRKT
jgi:hypothetical protein